MKHFILLLLLLSSLRIYGQYRPQNTQFVLNNYLINPAITGIETYTDIQTGFRSQWTGIEGAPETLYLTVHSPLGRTSNYTGLNPINTATGKAVAPNPYRPRQPHHGLGGMIMADEIGIFSRREAQLSYAYHLPMTHQLTLSAGLSGGLVQQRINTSKVILSNPNDQAIIAQSFNSLQPLVSLGLWAYSPVMYLGVSVLQILPGQSDGAPANGIMNAYLTGAYRFNVSPIMEIQPSAMVRMSEAHPIAYDMIIRAIWMNRFWVGGAYHSSEEFSGMAGFHISSLLSIAYAYDTVTGQYSQFSSGSHELVLNIRLANKNKWMCPQYMW